MKYHILLPVIALLFVGTGQPGPDVSLTVSRLFSDGVVLQRDVTVPVWGTAPAGASITIGLDDAAVEAKAGPDDTWEGALAPNAAGGPHTLTISDGQETITVQDVWFGDVWIASGQSNMEWPVAASADAENEIRNANDPLLRHYKVPRSWAYAPESSLAGGEWHTADASHVGAFTAVGYFFGRALRTAVNIPIGILNTSWGGSRIEAWMTPAMLDTPSDTIMAILDDHQQQIEEMRRRAVEEYGASETTDPGLLDDVAVWADPELDTASWKDIMAPGNWESAGYPNLDGVSWYRTTIALTADQIGSGTGTLHLDRIDDNDMTWINGMLVGRTNGWTNVRSYDIPEDVLQPGMNTIAVRVQDGAGNGGMVGEADELRLETSTASIPLAGTWKFRVGQVFINSAAGVNQLPTLLYNKMIHPILRFPITGFIWYQGESNAGDSENASRYAGQFQSMIANWRAAWGNDSAPFLFVSLASFRAAPTEPGESHWAVMRESQAAALSLPNVGQAITTDIGEADDIHPRNKQDVGLRLALAARHIAYSEDLVYSGPIFREHRVEDSRVILSFDHVGSGLVARGTSLGGFAIAGADGKFVWADASIVDDAVIVSSASVARPVAVRYAWADNPDRANLYNEEGLPAAPFRTDR